ncbi:hypothetical protein GCK72_014923 [Caenorhabditis remanei]|uniref:Uncharacterized protein n=1 Tax=Caenorhabditis remanei TaxID=31234 RepID=A0A6A5GVD9_CAERE|nr:hypothetical protein GCK72_014923 [Caenorhabditis remanei]KAF1758465.1 hypothetical protein GCK72_014923 [Caenorhabditis remanei]
MFGMFLTVLLVPFVVQCGKSKKPKKKPLVAKGKNSKIEKNKKTKKPSQKQQEMQSTDEAKSNVNEDDKEKNSKKSKKADTLMDSKKSKKNDDSMKAKSSQKTKTSEASLKENKPTTPKNEEHLTLTPENPIPGQVSVPPGIEQEYKPPPEHERPKHPGFEAQLEPGEENKTIQQVVQFTDAQDF